jgi:hypothetical protein
MGIAYHDLSAWTRESLRKRTKRRFVDIGARRSCAIWPAAGKRANPSAWHGRIEVSLFKNHHDRWAGCGVAGYREQPDFRMGGQPPPLRASYEVSAFQAPQAFRAAFTARGLPQCRRRLARLAPPALGLRD